MSGGQSRIELLQGTLDFIILQALRWGPQHGFGLAQTIRAHSSHVLQVDTGSLYPALHRLERAKLIDAKWDRSDKGQRVRVYRLTAAGRKRLAAERTKWERMTEAIAGILNPPMTLGQGSDPFAECASCHASDGNLRIAMRARVALT